MKLNATAPAAVLGRGGVGMSPGDILVFRTNGCFARGIQAATGPPWTWNHAAVYMGVVDGVPTIMEMTPSEGASFAPLSNYKPGTYDSTPRGLLSQWEQHKVLAAAHKLVDAPTSYGWVDIFVIGLLQVGIHTPKLEAFAESQKSMICSQSTAWCWAQAGKSLVKGKEPWATTPADIAREYNLTLKR